MYIWSERDAIPEYTHEMIHYRNAMVKEINFAFSDRLNKLKNNTELQQEFERFKDFREKTGNRMRSDIDRHKVWLGMLLEVLRSSLDFTSADLFIKYFNIPNEAYNADLYYLMQEPQSVYRQLLKEHSYNTAFEFLRFFPSAEALHEYGSLLESAVQAGTTEAFMNLIGYINDAPYDRMLKAPETKKLLENEYDKAERERRIDDARKLAGIMKDSDRMKRVIALDAMMRHNHKEAIDQLKEITVLSSFKEIVKEYYTSAMKKGDENNNLDEYKVAFSYAEYGKLSIDGDKRYLEEPAGKLFEHYVSKPSATEVDYFEADNYKSACNKQLVQSVVAKKMLTLVQNSERAMAKHLKNRFNVEFIPGEYKAEEDVRKFFRNLTDTYGQYEIPKGEENLLTALDVAELFNFSKHEIGNVKNLLFKFYLINKIFPSAKKYFRPDNKEMNDLAVKQVNTFVGMRDFNGAYSVIEIIPVQFSRRERFSRKKDLKRLMALGEASLRDLGMAIILDDIYELKTLSKSYYHQAFVQGLTAGPDGTQFLVDLAKPFNKRMEACGKIRLTNTVKRLLAEDRLSADILQRTYEKHLHPDIFDYIAYFLKRLLGIC